MNHRAILNVHPIAQANGIDIAAKYGVEPDTAVIAYDYIAHDSGVSAKGLFTDLGVKPRTDFTSAIVLCGCYFLNNIILIIS